MIRIGQEIQCLPYLGFFCSEPKELNISFHRIFARRRNYSIIGRNSIPGGCITVVMSGVSVPKGRGMWPSNIMAGTSHLQSKLF